MNLTPKAKILLRTLKIQHPGGRFESYMKRIRIPIPESVSGGEKVKFGLVIRIPEVWIRISIPESVFRGEEVKFGLVIRIPEVWIRIPIPESVFGGEEVKFGLVIRIPEVWI